MKITSPKYSAILLSLVLGGSALHAQTQIFDYNDPSQFDRLYREGTNNLWVNSDTGGISNTPWVRTGVLNNTIPGFQIVRDTFSTTQTSFTLGVNFLWKSEGENPAAGSNTGLILGFGKSASPEITYVPRFNGNDSTDPLGDATDQQLHLGFRTISGTNQVEVWGGGVTDKSRVYFGGGSSAQKATLAQNSWYYMEVVFDRGIINTTFDVTINLYESSIDGGKGTSILTQTFNRTNLNLLDTDVHAFIGGVTQRYSNVGGVDNFVVPIPEPGSTALVVGGVIAAAVCRFRKAVR